MKFKTFRALVVSGLGLAGLAVCIGLSGIGRSPRVAVPTPAPPLTDEQKLAVRLTPVAAATAGASSGNLRSMDSRILAVVEQPLVGDKGKDAIPGQAWKVNLYQDAGQIKVNRLKVDLDRDEKWDEKWSRVDASWKRQVSSRDDDQYDQEYFLRDGSWAGSAGASAVGTAAPPVAATPAVSEAPIGGSGALRPLDQQILDKARQPIVGDKIKDAFGAGAWKVNIYQDAGNTKPNRLKIDFDRDEKWDEKWDFEGDEVKRHVAPNDDDVYTKEYRLRQGKWVEK